MTMLLAIFMSPRIFYVGSWCFRHIVIMYDSNVTGGHHQAKISFLFLFTSTLPTNSLQTL